MLVDWRGATGLQESWSNWGSCHGQIIKICLLDGRGGEIIQIAGRTGYLQGRIGGLLGNASLEGWVYRSRTVSIEGELVVSFQSIPIAEAITEIERQDIVLPAIQREFVWGPERIARLFDSLMQGYPIGTLL